MKAVIPIKPSMVRGPAALDVQRVRRDFPILSRRPDGRPFAYLDNAATTQKPRPVIGAMNRFYRRENANIHRGVYALSVRATEAYEKARAKVQRFIGASRPEEVIFVRGATEAINLVASSYGRSKLRAGDEVVITTMEHHSNIVPWQMVCAQTGAYLRIAPIDDAGKLDMDALEALIGPRTKIVAVTHVSNVLGTVNPIRRIVEVAHRQGAAVVVDGAQAAPHLPIDVAALGCDFYALSGHKMYGPGGIGALYGRYDLLKKMPPYQGGGDMIRSVSFEGTLYADPPQRFEAGTPHVAGALGLAAAVDYLDRIGMVHAAAYEQELLAYGTSRLTGVPGVRIIGTAPEKVGVLSFVVEGIHPHDLGTILDVHGVAIRAGHHCAQPLMERFGVPATARASLAFYNTREEIDALVDAIGKAIEVFG